MFLDAHPVRGDTLQMPLMLEPPKPDAVSPIGANEPLPLFERLSAAERPSGS
jgi:hypothetical protein